MTGINKQGVFECPVCEGEGKVQGEVDYDNNDVPIWNLEECLACEGTGKLKNYRGK